MGRGGDRCRGLSDPAGLMRHVACLALGLVVLLSAGCTTYSSYAPIRDRSTQQAERAAGGYLVQRGDTLYSIAWKHGLDYQTVAAWNRIPPPYTIYAGQRIQLRPPAAAATRPASPRSADVRAQPPTAGVRSPIPSPGSAPHPGPDAMPIWQWPATGPILRRFDGDASGKKGISIGGTHGSQVRAAAPGQVVYAGSGLVGYGRLIIIKHNDNYLSAYGHNRNLLVNEGDAVRSGQVIAEMGSSGTNRIQLHFEIRRKGKPVDPLRYLPRR